MLVKVILKVTIISLSKSQNKPLCGRDYLESHFLGQCVVKSEEKLWGNVENDIFGECGRKWVCKNLIFKKSLPHVISVLFLKKHYVFHFKEKRSKYLCQ